VQGKTWEAVARPRHTIFSLSLRMMARKDVMEWSEIGCKQYYLSCSVPSIMFPKQFKQVLP